MWHMKWMKTPSSVVNWTWRVVICGKQNSFRRRSYCLCILCHSFISHHITFLAWSSGCIQDLYIGIGVNFDIVWSRVSTVRNDKSECFLQVAWSFHCSLSSWKIPSCRVDSVGVGGLDQGALALGLHLSLCQDQKKLGLTASPCFHSPRRDAQLPGTYHCSTPERLRQHSQQMPPHMVSLISILHLFA